MGSPEILEPLILAIETSCDETAAAVVRGRTVLSNIIASQVEFHRQWGGVVPEAAARVHLEAIGPVIESALAEAGVAPTDIRAVAVTNRPGLIGALSVGLTAAKAFAMRFEVPLLGIHHLEGHMAAILGLPAVEIPLPHLSLIVSGGHTELVRVNDWGDYKILGETRDDAAGEAFDKAARLMGLGTPGGYAIQEAARSGDPRRYPFPLGLKGDTIDFSFSGLKTAVLRRVEAEGDQLDVPDCAASLQATIVKVLTERSLRAVERFNIPALSLVGGVAANEALRRSLADACARASIQFFTPPLALCTDNAAMIGLAAAVRFSGGQQDDLHLEAMATEEIGRSTREGRPSVSLP